MNILIDITPDEFNQILGGTAAADTSIKVDDTPATERNIVVDEDSPCTLNIKAKPYQIEALQNLLDFIHRHLDEFKADSVSAGRTKQLLEYAKDYAKLVSVESVTL